MKSWMKKLRNWLGLCQEEDEIHINLIGSVWIIFLKKKKKIGKRMVTRPGNKRTSLPALHQ